MKLVQIRVTDEEHRKLKLEAVEKNTTLQSLMYERMSLGSETKTRTKEVTKRVPPVQTVESPGKQPTSSETSVSKEGLVEADGKGLGDLFMGRKQAKFGGDKFK
jgi:hypothetical protein